MVSPCSVTLSKFVTASVFIELSRLFKNRCLIFKIFYIFKSMTSLAKHMTSLQLTNIPCSCFFELFLFTNQAETPTVILHYSNFIAAYFLNIYCTILRILLLFCFVTRISYKLLGYTCFLFCVDV